jgi:hypothetical protein
VRVARTERAIDADHLVGFLDSIGGFDGQECPRPQ